jgi:hypothetical protein
VFALNAKTVNGTKQKSILTGDLIIKILHITENDKGKSKQEGIISKG